MVNNSSIEDLKSLLGGTVADYETLNPQVALRFKAAALKMWIKCL
jgi:hypothetical protein